MAPSPLGVLLVDDNPGYREVASRLLAADPRVRLLGGAATAEEALEMLEGARPDLVMMDLSLPGMNGLEATRQIKARPGAPKVVIVTWHDEPEYREAALHAGADGYVVKSELRLDLRQVIHHAGAASGVR